jgi:hypothetical protein
MVSANVSGRGTPNISGKHILHLVENSTDFLGKCIVIWVKLKFPVYVVPGMKVYRACEDLFFRP